MRRAPPSVRSSCENEVVDGVADSLAEDADSPVPNITHRYPDRVLFLVSPVCAAYCRFCTRRRKVGDPEKIPLDQFDAAFAYVRQHTEVRHVTLSGGDPLMLSDRRIEHFLRTLRAIPHVEIVPIHTRTPSQLPERITPALCETIRKYRPVFVNVHVNHPDELTPATRAAPARLADAGCPLGSQTLLLKGVNDDPAIMKRLMCHAPPPVSWSRRFGSVVVFTRARGTRLPREPQTFRSRRDATEATG